ncbi:MAG: hypothetical protein EOP83_33850 [Verrucomicrobiaceae bacterium]|nr:MAG: hypothetical protein EOP83_33850 [Verrucomicrobiaceae bacterium]
MSVPTNPALALTLHQKLRDSRSRLRRLEQDPETADFIKQGMRAECRRIIDIIEGFDPQWAEDLRAANGTLYHG